MSGGGGGDKNKNQQLFNFFGSSVSSNNFNKGKNMRYAVEYASANNICSLIKSVASCPEFELFEDLLHDLAIIST